MKMQRLDETRFMIWHDDAYKKEKIEDYLVWKVCSYMHAEKGPMFVL